MRRGAGRLRGPRQYPTSSDLRPARREEQVTWTHQSVLFGPVLRATYPCCGQPARFAVIDVIPREVYGRRCGQCQTKWRVERRQVRREQEVRVDILEWSTALVEVYAKNRRALLS